MKFYLPFLIFTSLFIFAFKKVNPDDFQAYYKANLGNYMQVKNTDEFEYKILYKPFQLGLIDYVKRENPDAKAYKNYIKDSKNSLDFVMKLAIPSQTSGDFLKYEKGNKNAEERLKYYSFTFQNDIKLIVNTTDTLSPIYYNFERAFDARQNGEFFFSFDLKGKSVKDIEIRINDRGFEEKTIAFSYTKDKLYKFPALKNYKKW